MIPAIKDKNLKTRLPATKYLVRNWLFEKTIAIATFSNHSASTLVQILVLILTEFDTVFHNKKSIYYSHTLSCCLATCSRAFHTYFTSELHLEKLFVTESYIKGHASSAPGKPIFCMLLGAALLTTNDDRQFRNSANGMFKRGRFG